MRYEPIDPKLFIENRARLMKELPAGAVAVLTSNEAMPTNADGSFPLRQNSDLLYLTGVEQEETLLFLFPSASEEKFREILFIRQPSESAELWEGRKLRKEEAQRRTGIKTVKWSHEFWLLFHRLVLDAESIHLNLNEHKRAASEVRTREDRLVVEMRERYPLHRYERLAPLLHRLRLVKSEREIALIDRASQLTGAGFRRALKFVRPGISETELEAEFAHEFIRGGGRFAYEPIIASGKNACVLHYIANSERMKKGQLLLLDVAAAYANYNSDLTRTIPVSGRFSRRQRELYDAVLRVQRKSVEALRPGLRVKDWQHEAELAMQEELLELGILTAREVKKQDPEMPAVKKYFMHGLGHPIGLDVHDVGDMNQPMEAGWVMTVEPGVYLPNEEIGIRLEDTVLVTDLGPVNLMADIPMEADEIEAIMSGASG